MPTLNEQIQAVLLAYFYQNDRLRDKREEYANDPDWADSLEYMAQQAAALGDAVSTLQALARANVCAARHEEAQAALRALVVTTQPAPVEDEAS
jgi:hypothetical protein